MPAMERRSRRKRSSPSLTAAAPRRRYCCLISRESRPRHDSAAVRRTSALVEAVERVDLVGFGERGIVEDGVAEILDGRAQAHGRLSNVDDLSRAVADHVHAEYLICIRAEEDLEHA